ncbi:MAG: hypothetical protein RL180_1375, partial [Pseudomonadota bacterium]
LDRRAGSVMGHSGSIIWRVLYATHDVATRAMMHENSSYNACIQTSLRHLILIYIYKYI